MRKVSLAFPIKTRQKYDIRLQHAKQEKKKKKQYTTALACEIHKQMFNEELQGLH
jgi:fido (protein-threonine AMPylation protein)